MPTSLQTELYRKQTDTVWPRDGRHILAQFDDTNIIVYQAFCPEIATYAVANGHFGGPQYSFSRMTWIKTNFLWMMYRSSRASSKGQERILAISLCKKGFDEILKCSRGSRIEIADSQQIPDNVRLQWDPDHCPKGGKIERRAIQLGLRGDMVKRFNEEWIQKIEDITDFVKQQRSCVLNDELNKLDTPSEREYIPGTEDICRHILLDGYAEKGRPRYRKECTETVSILDGACCSELLDESLHVTIGEQFRGCDGREVRDVILCLGGAFNPVHTRHVQVMLESRKWLEENTNFRVVAGYFAVAPDGYVRRKCEKVHQKCITGEHRIKLCEIACEEHTWLNPYPKTIGSAEDCGKKVLKDMNLHNKADIAVIYGADRAMNNSGKAKWHKKSTLLTLCIGRKGETETIKRAYLEDKKIDLVRNDHFFIVPHELDNVSSSEVRRMLSIVAGIDDGFTRHNDVNNINMNDHAISTDDDSCALTDTTDIAVSTGVSSRQILVGNPAGIATGTDEIARLSVTDDIIDRAEESSRQIDRINFINRIEDESAGHNNGNCVTYISQTAEQKDMNDTNTAMHARQHDTDDGDAIDDMFANTDGRTNMGDIISKTEEQSVEPVDGNYSITSPIDSGRRKAMNDIVRIGFISENEGNYLLENFTELYVN